MGGKGTFRAAARANLTRRSTDDGRPKVTPSACRFQHSDAAQRICRYRCTLPMRGGFTGAVQKPQNAEREPWRGRAADEGEPPLAQAGCRPTVISTDVFLTPLLGSLLTDS
jgi:hypothetical protein